MQYPHKYHIVTYRRLHCHTVISFCCAAICPLLPTFWLCPECHAIRTPTHTHTPRAHTCKPSKCHHLDPMAYTPFLSFCVLHNAWAAAHIVKPCVLLRFSCSVEEMKKDVKKKIVTRSPCPVNMNRHGFTIFACVSCVVVARPCRTWFFFSLAHFRSAHRFKVV